MSIRLTFVVLATGLVAFSLGAQSREAPKIEKSPHAAALELVINTEPARIREVDAENWWHDVKERTWVVKRPFAPGTIDSTHLFNVSYKIEGKEAATWLVDTREGKVQEVQEPKKKP